jgi:hypothetical protein
LVIDASVIPKSGKQTSGRDRCWHGSHGRSKKGLDISALAWLDITATCAYALRVDQPPPTRKATGPESTRIDVSRDPWTRVVSAHDLRPLRSVITDGSDSQQQCIRGVRAFGRHQMGTLRIDAHRRSLSQGPQRLGSGRPKTYDGTVNWDDLRRFERIETEENHSGLSHQVLNHVQFQWNLRVVLVVDPKHTRRAVLLSTDVDVEALPLSRYDTARCHIAFLFRDATQCTGLCDCQARSQAKRDLHFHASVTAVTLAKLEARQHNGDVVSSFSMARLKRRACNQHRIDRIGEQFAKGHRVEKSSPEYEDLCHYGSIPELAA